MGKVQSGWSRTSRARANALAMCIARRQHESAVTKLCVRVTLSSRAIVAMPRSFGPTSHARTSLSSSSAVGSSLVPILFFILWMRTPFVTSCRLPSGLVIVLRVGARKRLSWPVSVLARISAMLQSVAEENHLKPERR